MKQRLVFGTQIPYLKAVNAVRADPITGCTNGADICAVSEDCWAKSMAEAHECEGCVDHHEHGCPPNGCYDPFKPAFHPEVLDAIKRLRKPHVIAWDFGGDRCCDGVDPAWRDAEYDCMEATPQHVHVMLTKKPENLKTILMGGNCWYGVSITGPKNPREWESAHSLSRFFGPLISHRFFSFEPLLGSVGTELELGVMFLNTRASWIVIGGKSNSDKHVLRPDEPGGIRAEWAQPVINGAARAGCKIFTKNITHIWRELVNPRTGKLMQNPRELREVPDEWRSLV